MSSAQENRTGQSPLLVCGLPRAGTSALFSALILHSAFAGGDYVVKEARHVEHMIGERFWNPFASVDEALALPFDQEVTREVIRTIDRCYRRLLGGRSHQAYVNANPHDVFYIKFIAEAVDDALFVIMLRPPLETVWSMLNHPSGIWSLTSDRPAQQFSTNDVAQCCLHWNKVATATIAVTTERTLSSRALIRSQVALQRDPGALVTEILDFAGLDHEDIVVNYLNDRIIHSSFQDSHTPGSGSLTGFYARNREAVESRSDIVSAVHDQCASLVDRLHSCGIDLD